MVDDIEESISIWKERRCKREKRDKKKEEYEDWYKKRNNEYKWMWKCRIRNKGVSYCKG